MKIGIRYLFILIVSLFFGIVPVNADNSGILLSKNELTLGVGYSETLKYTLSSGLNSSNIIWTSSNEKVATVHNGKVTAITEGFSIITASINGRKSTCRVNVSSSYVPVKGVSLNKTTLNILIGSSDNLVANVSPNNATNKDLIWTSSDNSIVSVENGRVRANKIGSAIITVSSSGYRATCKVNVVNVIALNSISLNKTNITIKEKSSEVLSVIYVPNNATNKKVTWKSSNTNVATVDSQGRVTGINPGSATITVVSNDGGYVSLCKVVVEAISKKVENVVFEKKEISIIAGEKTKLNITINPSYAENKNVTWTSSDKNIVTVKDGEITAIAPGKAEIKVVTEDGNKEAICVVTVNSPPIKGISFAKIEQTVYVDSKTTLKTISEPENAILENPVWTSSDEKVATVENGVLKALSIGETIITVSNKDNSISATMTIKVVNKPKEKLNITIEGYDLKFDPKVKNYTLKIGKEDSLVINTNVNKNKVKINGNQNLKNGSIITINVSEQEKVTYVINIKKNENYTIYFIAIISVLLLLNLIRIFIKNKKKKS